MVTSDSDSALLITSSPAMVSIVMAASGRSVSTSYGRSALAEAELPASSSVVTLASTLALPSRSTPGTFKFQVLPSVLTVVVNSLPPIVMVTVSPALTSLPTVPEMATSASDSALLTMSSSAITLIVMSASGGVTSTSYGFSSVAVVVLPASSVVVTLASTLSLLISSEPGTSTFQVLPSGLTVVSYSLPPTVTVT